MKREFTFSNKRKTRMEVVEVIVPVAQAARALANWTHPRKGTTRNTNPVTGKYIGPMAKKKNSIKNNV